MSAITEYYGDLMVSPIPLEMALNYCSHKCAVCFANLNKPDRTADTKAIFTQLQNYPNQANLAAHFLREKYPVLISNRVDPFAISNYQLTLPMVENMLGQGIPVTYQTRGGKGIETALALHKAANSKALWYVSICHTDDADRKRCEPGAPSIESRWELIDQLREAGQPVVVGANPLVPEWVDVDQYVERLVRHKVKNVWHSALHLNRDQVNNMTDRERAAVGPELIKRASTRLMVDHEREHSEAFEAACVAEGIETFTGGQSKRSGFFQLYHDTYPGKTIPTIQDFINHCFDTRPDGDIIRLNDFLKFMLPHLPKGEYSLRGYLASHARIWKDIKLPGKMSFRNLLELYWNSPKLKRNLSNYDHFAYMVYEGPLGLEYMADATDGESLLIIFDRKGFENQEFLVP